MLHVEPILESTYQVTFHGPFGWIVRIGSYGDAPIETSVFIASWTCIFPVLGRLVLIVAVYFE
jgi:hypothetical protein